jgi:hypothetical protein
MIKKTGTGFLRVKKGLYTKEILYKEKNMAKHCSQISMEKKRKESGKWASLLNGYDY